VIRAARVAPAPTRRAAAASIAAAFAVACGASEPASTKGAAAPPRIEPPAGFAQVASLCAAIASCAGPREPGAARDPSACAEAWLARAYGPRSACLLRAGAPKAGDGCAAIRACLRGDDPAAAAFCDAHPGVFTACDGARFVSCGGDDGRSTAVDCAALGASCAEARIASGVVERGCASPRLCPEGAPEARCEGDAGSGAIVTCHAGIAERIACGAGERCAPRADEGGAPSAACALDDDAWCDDPGDSACDGHDLVTCAPYGEGGARTRTDCAKLGLACRERGRRAACVVPGAEPCAGDGARCDGDRLVYCAAGVLARVACASAGLGPCRETPLAPGAACDPPVADRGPN